MNSRKYLVGVVLISLLIWGPVEHSWPAWFVIRVSYLLIISILVWFLLKWIWILWKPDAEEENRLARALSAATSGVLLTLAIVEIIADTHIGNTMQVQTRDGIEDVGDFVIMKGPDFGNAFMLMIASAFAFWFSVSKEKSKN